MYDRNSHPKQYIINGKCEVQCQNSTFERYKRRNILIATVLPRVLVLVLVLLRVLGPLFPVCRPNGPFRNLEKETEESAVNSDSLGNSRKSRDSFPVA